MGSYSLHWYDKLPSTSSFIDAMWMKHMYVQGLIRRSVHISGLCLACQQNNTLYLSYWKLSKLELLLSLYPGCIQGTAAGIYAAFGKCSLYTIFSLYRLCPLRFKTRSVMVLVVAWKWSFNILADTSSYSFNRMGENSAAFGSDWYWPGIIFDLHHLFEIIPLRYSIV